MVPDPEFFQQCIYESYEQCKKSLSREAANNDPALQVEDKAAVKKKTTSRNKASAKTKTKTKTKARSKTSSEAKKKPSARPKA